jgi:hippurate hydrolase
MGAEDFAYMLAEKPGSYIWVGQFDQGHREQVHHPGYNFNDRILPIGASYFSRLVERALPKTG